LPAHQHSPAAIGTAHRDTFFAKSIPIVVTSIAVGGESLAMHIAEIWA
jgi:hypothetical protein